MKLLVLAIVAASFVAFALACDSSSDEPERPRITVVSYNILHGITNEDEDAEPFDRMPERIELIARSLAEAQPDIITLQEVFLDASNGYPDVRQILLDALGPEYTAIHGDVRGNQIGSVESLPLGQMTITRLPVVSSENHFIAGVRSIHRVTVETESGPIDVYNTHLEGTGAVSDAGEPEALLEMEEVLGFIESTQTGAGPVILAGDLNATPDESSIVKLIDEGWIDALVSGGNETCEQVGDPGCTSGNIPLADPAEKADHRIDYIWARSGTETAIVFRVASLFNEKPFEIGGGAMLWASDHIGVQAEFEIRLPPAQG
jgi:endonuclease/exonuclease/phosphatase family metal-dependent hydrolase